MNSKMIAVIAALDTKGQETAIAERETHVIVRSDPQSSASADRAA